LFLRFRTRIAVAIAFAVPLVVLLATVRTSVGFWDTGDLQTVAWIAGIPYPTGFPLYVVAGWVWTHAIPLGSVAARLNALSAVAVAGGAAAVCAIAISCDVAAVLAVLAGWTFAFSAPVWLRATYADVHPVGFAVAFVAIVFAVRWVKNGRTRDIVAAIVAAAVAVGVDNTTVLILAGAVVIVLERRPALRTVALATLAGVVVVVAAYAYLPLRSAHVTAARVDPTLALGLPPGRPFWDDHHPSSLDGFISLVGGTAFSPDAALRSTMSPHGLAAAAARYAPMLGADFPLGLAIAGPAGLALRARRRPLLALGLTLAGAVPAIFGSTYRVEADPERYAFALYAVCALGIAFAAGEVIDLFHGRGRAVAQAALAFVLLAVLAEDVARSGPLFSYRDDPLAVAWGDEVTRLTRDDAIVVAPWLSATPLAYRAYVEHRFGTRILVCGWAGDYTAEYPRWARIRQLVIASDYVPAVTGHQLRLLSAGSPGLPALFEVVP
jgi:hypothetical protein